MEERKRVGREMNRDWGRKSFLLPFSSFRLDSGLIPGVHAVGMAVGSEVGSKHGGNLYQCSDGETGTDRLRMMFSFTDSGSISPEIQFINKTIAVSLFVGSFIGATISSRNAIETVLRKYRSNVYVHQFEARRHFQDNITLIMMKNAFKWAWRLSLFSGMYSTFVVSCAVYNNKTSIWEHIAAGALCGSIWKLKLGIRATAVGCATGGTLGLICGCTTAALLWAAGTSVKELRYWHHEYWEKEYMRRVESLQEKKPDGLSE
ncbi:RPII140-upstream gene protein [Centruroides vittatus]|uniref:RPII140-upstream gene protein n=1 Tax=Centruroides vittatus TaxID=120091 RepID=UPI00350EBFDA